MNGKNEIRLMSHNIWNNDENTPEWQQIGEDCSAQARVKGLMRVYKETMPDVIGCQEASSLMTDLLAQEFAREKLKYAIVWGRYTPIIYRVDKFELIDTEFCTYPETIKDFEGEFNDAKSKSFNICVFREKVSGKMFVFATTHLWWKFDITDPRCLVDSRAQICSQAHSDAAREFQLALLAGKIKEYTAKYACIGIVVGDLNTGYNSKAVQKALSLGFEHAHNIAVEYVDESVGYHDCFPFGFTKEYLKSPFEDAIDHILVLNAKSGEIKRFERYSPEYYFPISDHSPVFIDVSLK